MPRARHAEGLQKLREMAVFRAFFERLSPGVNGVGKRDIYPVRRDDSSSAILPVVAHLCSLRRRSGDPRDVAAPAAHRFTPESQPNIQEKGGGGSPPKPRYRLMSQQPNGLQVLRILRERNIPRQRGPVTARVARIPNGGCNGVDKSHRKRGVSPGLQEGDEGVRSQAA